MRRPHRKRAEAPQHAATDDGSGAFLSAAAFTPSHTAVEMARSHRRYALPDLRVGDPAAADPLATRSWPELRELIYGGADVR